MGDMYYFFCKLLATNYGNAGLVGTVGSASSLAFGSSQVRFPDTTNSFQLLDIYERLSFIFRMKNKVRNR